MLAMLAMIMLASHAFAEVATTARTETSLTANVKAINSGKAFWALLHIKLKEGWHTYWKNPGDSGTSPILQWTLPKGFTAGEIAYQAPERLPTGPLMDYGYNNDAYYLIPLQAPGALQPHATSIIMLKAQWLVCKDVCVPEKAEFSLVLPVAVEAASSTEAALIDELVGKLPKPVTEIAQYAIEGGNVRFTAILPEAVGDIRSASFFPATDGIIANMAEQKTEIQGSHIAFTIKQGDNAALTEGEGVVSLFAGDGQRKDYAIKLKKGVPETSVKPVSEIKTAKPQPQQGADLTLYSSVLLALLGGLILNLMPCVLPILSLKVLSVAKKAKSHRSAVRGQALAYTFGVVLSFMALAVLLITLQKLAGESLGWGFQMQSPVFVSLLSIVMFLVGLNLSGAYELPVMFGNVGGQKAAEDSTVGSFLTGVLAVVVATPCTAPFMAPAIGFALTQTTPAVLAIFAALGIGLAAPFLLFSIFPSLASLLPKPGAWMLVLRQFLAFPIYLTVVWLLWVLAGEAGANGAAIAMLGMVGAAFCMFLFERESALAWVVGAVLAVAGIAAMLHYVEAMPRMRQPVALGDQAEPYSPSRLEELRKAGKPVFVDATAQWCITCKVNETVALARPEVKEAFHAKGITTLVADWTNGDPEITKYLQSFGRSGVPIYVYYPAGGEPVVLPQLLTPNTVLEAIGK